MKQGVPVAGGSSGALVRERASATPAHLPRENGERAQGRRSTPEKPVHAPLGALQAWFASAVMHPTSVEASLRERVGLGEPFDADSVERVVLPSSRLSGIERIEIYHHAYMARLVECLADDYPALRHALGESDFEDLCRAYVAAFPSQSPNLNAFGRHMSAFCRARPMPLATFAADLAALEWAMVEVVHGAASLRLSKDALALIPASAWPGAHFAASDTVRVLEFASDVNAYFQAFNTGESTELPQPEWAATVVFRDGATIWRMGLSRAMHGLLVALFDGSTLGAALDAVASAGLVGDDEAPLVMRWFQEWVGYGFFAGVST